MRLEWTWLALQRNPLFGFGDQLQTKIVRPAMKPDTSSPSSDQLWPPRVKVEAQMTSHIALFPRDTSSSLAPYDLPLGAVIAGDPKPRAWSVARDEGDGRQSISGVFEADAGTIRNVIRAIETIHVLAGRVRIELDTGDSVELAVGDSAVLTPGPVATWIFFEPYRELFVVSGAPA